MHRRAKKCLPEFDQLKHSRNVSCRCPRPKPNGCHSLASIGKSDIACSETSLIYDMYIINWGRGMSRILVDLPDSQVDDLAAIVEAEHRPRAAVIRDAIEAYISQR